jgi:hypothetical protein
MFNPCANAVQHRRQKSSRATQRWPERARSRAVGRSETRKGYSSDPQWATLASHKGQTNTHRCCGAVPGRSIGLAIFSKNSSSSCCATRTSKHSTGQPERQWFLLHFGPLFCVCFVSKKTELNKVNAPPWTWTRGSNPNARPTHRKTKTVQCDVCQSSEIWRVVCILTFIDCAEPGRDCIDIFMRDLFRLMYCFLSSTALHDQTPTPKAHPLKKYILSKTATETADHTSC